MGEKATNYEFEGFRIDGTRRCLWHADTLVALTPKAFATLMMLVENSGEIVDKDALLDEVWADTFVEESTLSQNILTIRKTLKTFNATASFIATVPRRGYRFVAPVKKTNGSREPKSNGHSNGHELAAPAAEFSPPKAETWSSGRLVFVGMILGLLAVTVITAAFYLGSPLPMSAAKFREFRVAELLSDANIKAAAISPDAKYLALTERQGAKEKLTIRQLNGSNAIEAVPLTEAPIVGAAFGPGGEQVYFTQFRAVNGTRLGELYRVPVLGGAPQLVASDVDSPVSISSAGNLAFVRRRIEQKDTELIVTDVDGKNERVVATRAGDEGFLNASISPDGRFIASAVNSKASLDRPMELVITNTTNGEQRPLSEQSWLWIGQIAWLPDASGVVLVGYGAMSPDLTDEVWLVSTDGKTRILENGVNGVFGVSVTGDGNSIVAVKSDKITSLAVAPLTDLGNPTVIATKAGDQSLLQLDADWTADRIVFATTANGNADIWSMNADGTDRRQLTSDKYADLGARVSPDGKSLYFLSNRSGKMSVWRCNIDGSEPRKLTDGADAFSVDVAPNGGLIYYTLRANSIFMQHLWRASADGSDAVELTTKPTLSPRLSPDGKTIACYYPLPEARVIVLTLLDAATGTVIKQFPDRRNDTLIEWQQDGNGLLLVSREGADSVLWKQPLSGAAVKLQTWPNETIFRVAVSPQGDRLFYEKGVFANHVVMLSDRAR